ncbi:hypothetical protein [Borrelia sp. RT1S]|uniref:hypothetical protein n=1 Tax=Borrelia sp. RT1S TaxID=2898580 RepID=UPI001E3B780A|nr:hypothetical protein [Borrelia sp. RT1S]UGQ17810.1 hypothetical protein LSO05_05110 [Borrelia sp. RT1S]
MTLEDIIIPLSIATQNEEKLDAMAAAPQEMASQQFDNIAKLERNLGGVGKAAKSVKAAQDAMIKQARQTAEAQKKVADSVAGIGQKTAGVKSLGASFKSMGKNLVDVKGFANKVDESLEQVVASMGPLALL